MYISNKEVEYNNNKIYSNDKSSATTNHPIKRNLNMKIKYTYYSLCKHVFWVLLELHKIKTKRVWYLLITSTLCTWYVFILEYFYKRMFFYLIQEKTE